MTLRVRHTLDDLVDDLETGAKTGPAKLTRLVSKNIRRGTGLTRAFARASAGKHGKHYPRSIGSEMTRPTTGEWGPDPAMPQGGMSFERGSRNQPPHLDHQKAADIVVVEFHDDVDDVLDQTFWPSR